MNNKFVSGFAIAVAVAGPLLARAPPVLAAEHHHRHHHHHLKGENHSCKAKAGGAAKTDAAPAEPAAPK